LDNHLITDGKSLITMNDGHDDGVSDGAGKLGGKMMSDLASHGATYLHWALGLV
jgi:hypothetical protein